MDVEHPREAFGSVAVADGAQFALGLELLDGEVGIDRRRAGTERVDFLAEESEEDGESVHAFKVGPPPKIVNEYLDFLCTRPYPLFMSKNRKKNARWGRTISVQFALPDEDRIIREVAAQIGPSAAWAVRTLALEAARARMAENEKRQVVEAVA